MSQIAQNGSVKGLASKMRLLGNSIVVRPSDKNDRTDGGILLPEVSEIEKFRRAKVVAVGPGLFAGINPTNGQPVVLPMGVKVGDTVIVDLSAGVPLGTKDDPLLLYTETRVMAVIEGE